MAKGWSQLMHSENPPQIPPILTAPPRVKQRAPTLYLIIAFKLLKGLVLLVLAFAVYSVRDLNLQQEFQRVLLQANLNPADELFAGSASLLGGVSAGMMRVIVAGSALYGAFSLVEGAGLMLRAAWAGWMAITESAIFVPVELWEMKRSFSILVAVVLVLNVAIVWYLVANRHRLFPQRKAAALPLGFP
jgi:uncharacterized membrane protein (DUF2068 family)